MYPPRNRQQTFEVQVYVCHCSMYVYVCFSCSVFVYRPLPQRHLLSVLLRFSVCLPRPPPFLKGKKQQTLGKCMFAHVHMFACVLASVCTVSVYPLPERGHTLGKCMFISYVQCLLRDNRHRHPTDFSLLILNSTSGGSDCSQTATAVGELQFHDCSHSPQNQSCTDVNISLN